MSKLTPTLPLDGFAKAWPGFALKEHYRGELLSLACAAGNEKEFAASFKKVFGKNLPSPNEMIDIKGGFAMWSGLGQYMLLLSGENIWIDKDIAAKLKGAAYVTLQSDSWASLELKGARIFDVLERFIPLDLRRSSLNYAARTSAHHIAVIVVKHSDTQMQLLTPRSSGKSFLEGLVHTAENSLQS